MEAGARNSGGPIIPEARAAADKAKMAVDETRGSRQQSR